MDATADIALSLHQLTILDAAPGRLVDLAAMTGCAHVCLFTIMPDAAKGRYPLVTPSDVPQLRAHMKDAGVTIGNIEVFALDGQEDADAFARALDVGASLGATRATAHIHAISDPTEAVDRFAAFAALAHSFDIVAGLEFMRFSAIRTLSEAAQIVRQAKRGMLACDALHLFREGGSVEEVAANADLISYVQLSDGPHHCPDDQRWNEAVKTRELPGKGTFPLADLLSVLHQPLLVEVEVPRWIDKAQGMTDEDRARAAVNACNNIVSLALPLSSPRRSMKG